MAQHDMETEGWIKADLVCQESEHQSTSRPFGRRQHPELPLLVSKQQVGKLQKQKHIKLRRMDH